MQEHNNLVEQFTTRKIQQNVKPHLNMCYNSYFDFFAENNVLFATNGDNKFIPTFNLSTSLYKNIAKSFYCVESKIYGKHAFIKIFDYALAYKFKYVIYIDADCFICNYDNLVSCFNNFKQHDFIIGGIPDGGCIPIRNHNAYAINPFFSIFNMELISKINYSLCKFDCNNSHILQINIDNAIKCINKCPYGNTSKIKFDMFEPYYSIFLTCATLSPVKYFECTQLNLKNDTCSTCIYNDVNKQDSIICTHSWCSRNKTQSNQQRILQLYEYSKNLLMSNINEITYK